MVEGFPNLHAAVNAQRRPKSPPQQGRDLFSRSRMNHAWTPIEPDPKGQLVKIGLT